MNDKNTFYIKIPNNENTLYVKVPNKENTVNIKGTPLPKENMFSSVIGVLLI